jgi:hypothetical protein
MQTLVTMLLPQSNDKGLTIADTGTKFALRYKFARAAGVMPCCLYCLEKKISYVQNYIYKTEINR